MSMRSLFAGLAAAGVVLMSALSTLAAAPPEDAPEALVNKVYPVADLIVPLAGKTQEEVLVNLIQSTVARRTWTIVGGPGSIEYYPIGMALVVRQTPEIHEQLQDLLSALRRLQDVEVSVELRFLTVSDECLEKLGVVEKGESETRLLDETQVQLLLETVQGDPRTNILQAPKMTVFNGQKAMLDLSEKQCFVTGMEFVQQGDRKVLKPQTKNVNTGVQVSFLPVVALDNRTVTLQLAVNLARAEAPEPLMGNGSWMMRPNLPRVLVIPQQSQPVPASAGNFQTTVKMTDGATALLTGWTNHREMRNLASAPVLSKVPYINQLFRNFSYGKEGEHLLVLVTPHVFHREPDEREPAHEDGKADSAPMPLPPPKPAVPDAEARQTKPELAKEAATPAAWEVETPSAPTPAVVESAAQPPSVMHVRRRCFRLDYSLDNVGPTGVCKVAVWYRRDVIGWMQYDQEVPAKGHATITVPEDGRWGFTLIPYSGAGLSATPPKPGEEPQTWVEVDTQPPHVEILSATASLVQGEPMLCIHYRCEDAHLKSRPATISCPVGHGHCTILATGQAAGQVNCSLKGLPPEFDVRVEAEDQAGNVGVATTHINADLKIPRIRDVKVKVEE